LGLIAWAAAPGLAAGPLFVNGAGTPLHYATQPVSYSPDRGRLGRLDNATAIAFVASTFGVWQSVPTAAIAFADAGRLPVDVKVSNYTAFMDQCDGVSPVIFDDDGSITDDLLGVGARDTVLGFAGPECGDSEAGTITESIAVLNGRFIDGVSSTSNPETSLDDFAAVFLHEFGHFFNLDHSQVNKAEAFDGDASNDDAVPTMFPFLVNAAEASSLALDDQVSVSSLYPAPGFGTGGGTIRGRIARADGTGFQGAYVLARAVGDPRHVVVGVASGARFSPGSPGGTPPESLRGAYEIPGLPPGSYVIEVESIDGRFTGGSSVGPLDPPVGLPGPPERWNGSDEAATNPPDDPDDAVPVTVVAGGVVDGIDVILNEPVAPNDQCEAATPVTAIPFLDTEPATVATSAATDPEQACVPDGPSRNRASLWYLFTAPSAGRFVVETAASDYDTVLSAYTGSCDDLHAIGCSDDVASTVQSRLDLDLAAGAVLLVEVTAYHEAAPGTLRIAFHRGCVIGSGACDDGDPCTSGDGCVDGICLGPRATCDDANPCTADFCAADGACSHDALTSPCSDGDVCSIADACEASVCRSGARVDAAGLAAALSRPLPLSCGVERARVRHALARRIERAGARVARAGTRAGASRVRALRQARRLLAGLDRRARRLGRRGGACGDALAVRVGTARAQLECVANDFAADGS
jgi:predicted Zn-dependent protease with MMP-like domain